MDDIMLSEVFAQMGLPPGVPMPPNVAVVDILMDGPSTEPTFCAMCRGFATRRCNDCDAIYYCSAKCQIDDLHLHKLVCGTYKAFMETRPGPNHHSAIVLRPDEPKPRFVWLRDTPKSARPGQKQLSEIGMDSIWIKNVAHMECSYSYSVKRHIEPHHVMISSQRIKTLPDGPNQSFSEIEEDLSQLFRGTVLVWAVHCGSDKVKKSSDLDVGPMALRHAIDQLIHCFTTVNAIDKIAQEPSSDNLKAVRLNCDGDRHSLGRPTMEAVLEPTSTLEMDSEIETPIADRVGLPLIIRKVVPSILWRNSNPKLGMQNQRACMLNPPSQPADTGSLILVRKDGKPLHPDHLLALDGYVAKKLVDPSHPENACITPDMLLAHRIDQTSRKDFKRWYIHQWKKLPAYKKGTPSPYDSQALQSFRGMPTDINFS